jgi:hypothetical protein
MKRALLILLLAFDMHIAILGQDTVNVIHYNAISTQEGKTLNNKKMKINNLPAGNNFDTVLSRSFISTKTGTKKSLKEWIAAQQSSQVIATFKQGKLIIIDFEKIATRSLDLPLTVSIYNTQGDNQVSFKVDFALQSGRDASTPGQGSTAEVTRDDVLKEVSPQMKDTSVKWQFIDPGMFINASRTGGMSFPKKCIDSKQDASLGGEYLVVYDVKAGTYYALKKIVRKKKASKDNSCDKNYVEYYERKSSIFFTPPVGSQFKLELVNMNADDQLQISASYKDNFLEDEATFKSTFQAFNSKSNETGAGATTEKKNELHGSLNASGIANYLIALRNDLLYYTTHFYYSSFTAEQHEKNITAINNNIQEKLKTDLPGLLAAYLITMDKDDDLNVLMKTIRDTYNNLIGMTSMSFSAFRLKNMDYLELEFKNKQGNLVKEEEIRLSGGLKIDFSAGIGLTGLRDYSYFIKDTTVAYLRDTVGGGTSVDTSGKIIRRENDGKFDVRFGILMHVYPRLSSNYNVGLTVGISTNTNLDINLITGGSLLLGSTRRLVLTAGVIFGKVNRLSNSVQEGYHTTPAAGGITKPMFLESSTSVVPMIKQWNHSFYFGISWNLSH